MMGRWKRAGREGLLSGGVASFTSALALVAAARLEGKRPAAPVNAISHWLWGDRALARNAPSVRHTVAGYAVHHLSACFWAVFYERWRARNVRPARVLRDAAVTATIASVVDLRLTPHRFTPGFEHRLSRPSLFTVYAAFALGLAVTSLVRDASRVRYGRSASKSGQASPRRSLRRSFPARGDDQRIGPAVR